MRQFQLYADEMPRLERDERRLDLAISTNPHTEGKDQKKLWSALAPLKRKVVGAKDLSKAEKERIAELLGRPAED